MANSTTKLGSLKYSFSVGGVIGEAQRLEAFKLGVNCVLYALTVNYKQDLIHIPFIRKKLG